jgi:ABC-type bacteriocin/lantibiotic exporter with double-glycine peptidase domain
LKPTGPRNACGMACGQRLLERYGVRVFQSNLASGFYRGLEPRTLAENLNRYHKGWIGGYVGILLDQEIEALARKAPFIARIGGNPGHFVIVETVEDGVATIWDPEGGVTRSERYEEFVTMMTGVVYQSAL